MISKTLWFAAALSCQAFEFYMAWQVPYSHRVQWEKKRTEGGGLGSKEGKQRGKVRDLNETNLCGLSVTKLEADVQSSHLSKFCCNIPLISGNTGFQRHKDSLVPFPKFSCLTCELIRLTEFLRPQRCQAHQSSFATPPFLLGIPLE